MRRAEQLTPVLRTGWAFSPHSLLWHYGTIAFDKTHFRNPQLMVKAHCDKLLGQYHGLFPVPGIVIFHGRRFEKVCETCEREASVSLDALEA